MSNVNQDQATHLMPLFSYVVVFTFTILLLQSILLQYLNSIAVTLLFPLKLNVRDRELHDESRRTRNTSRTFHVQFSIVPLLTSFIGDFFRLSVFTSCREQATCFQHLLAVQLCDWCVCTRDTKFLSFS